MEHDWDWNMINYQEQSNIEVLSVQETKPDFSCVYLQPMRISSDLQTAFMSSSNGNRYL